MRMIIVVLEGQSNLDQYDHLFLQGSEKTFFEGSTLQRYTVEGIIRFVDLTEEKLAGR